MKRRACPRCRARMLTDHGDGFVSCLMCGQVVKDEVSRAATLLWNTTPQDWQVGDVGGNDYGPRQEPDIEAVKARVMDRIRQEAGA